MSEKLSNVEHRRSSHSEIERAAAERLKSIESNGERPENKEKSIEKAREMLKQAEAVQPKHETTTKNEGGHSHRAYLTPSINYKQTMRSLQHRMKPATRQFSKFIDSPVVDSTSEALGKTVFRPSVTLGATTTAVIVGGLLYIFARVNGFTLSGSEILFALLIGGILGLIIEGILKSARRLRGKI